MRTGYGSPHQGMGTKKEQQMKTRISQTIKKRVAMLLVPFLMLGAITVAAHADKRAAEPNATLLVTGLEELQGSAVGPGGALFVTAPLAGSIWRVAPKTGAVMK